MKILHICGDGFTAKNLLRSQIDYFRSLGAEVEIACCDDQHSRKLKDGGYVIHNIPPLRSIAPLKFLKGIYQLKKVICSGNYQIVHVHNPVASIIGRIAAGLAGARRVVYTAHGFYFHDDMPSWLYALHFRLEKIMACITHLILVQSREDYDTAIRKGLANPRKIRHLGNGVDAARFDHDQLSGSKLTPIHRDLGIGEKVHPIIGTTARLTREKGIMEFAAASSMIRQRYPDLKVLVIGGQLKSEREHLVPELERIIDKSGLREHFIITGFREDIRDLLGLLQVFVLPSYREGMPRSVLEAMAMGLPVVATNVRGCREAVVNGETGILVPPRNSDALAEAILKILGNPSMAQSMGSQGRKRVEEEYDERQVFKRLEGGYNSLLSEGIVREGKA